LLLSDVRLFFGSRFSSTVTDSPDKVGLGPLS
jgi:hypothetical protein